LPISLYSLTLCCNVARYDDKDEKYVAFFKFLVIHIIFNTYVDKKRSQLFKTKTHQASNLRLLSYNLDNCRYSNVISLH
jgi:hypothetical protein